LFICIAKLYNFLEFQVYRFYFIESLSQFI
jgi:hypothetical protein